MYANPRTPNQHRENRDDAAADASQDRIDPNWTPELQAQINADAAAYRKERYRLLDLGYPPDQVQIMMLEWVNTKDDERSIA